jgi:hypothetical protein
MPDGFHDAFLTAIAGDPAALSPWCEPAAAEPGLSVYRNSIAKGCADALVAQFPSVERIVGAAWLAAAAAAHAAEQPPRQPSLLAYGQDFPDWLAGFAPAAELPYLADLARMDLMWTAAHLAADAPALDPAAVAALGPEDFASTALVLHPATRFAAFDDSSPSLWRALQPPLDAPTDFELSAEPQGLLLVRPDLEIGHRLAGPGELAFLAACGAGVSLAEAAVRALSAEPRLDLAAAFAGLVAAGAFSALRSLP